MNFYRLLTIFLKSLRQQAAIELIYVFEIVQYFVAYYGWLTTLFEFKYHWLAKVHSS